MSPLRQVADLAAHFQIKAHLRGQPLPFPENSSVLNIAGEVLGPRARDSTLGRLAKDCLFRALRSPELLALLQRSPSISYNKARLLHLLLLLSGVMHYVACIFVLVSRADTVLGDARQHYTSTPWLPDGSAETWRDQPETYEGGWVYLRAAYWAMMTLTTVGHVDQMDERDSQGGGSTFECVSRSRSGCLWGLPPLLAPSPCSLAPKALPACVLLTHTSPDRHRIDPMLAFPPAGCCSTSSSSLWPCSCTRSLSAT